ncbi:MAG: Inner membrane transport permease YbhR [Acidobacteria bacterium ADurb.Bin340]|nr:MAG: Inner membrane transport permease YbhR [Acidobacteria bacterium ADurb.Bin340]
MWNRIKALVWKELLQLRRDRMTLAFVVGIPLMQLIIFGLAINTDVKHLPAVVYDESNSQESRDFLDGLVATQYFDLKGRVASEAELRRSLDHGRAQAGIWFPPDYARRLRSGGTGSVLIVVDASNPTTAGNAIATAVGVAQLRSTALLFERMGYGQATRPAQPIEVRLRPWYNPNLRSPDFIVPGLVGVIVSFTCIIYGALSIAREKELGTLDQILVTPVTSLDLLLGKVLPVVAIAYIQLTVLLGAGALFFGVPFRGSIPLLYLCLPLFLAPQIGIALIISSRARTQSQATQMGMFSLLPMIFLSGYIFQIEGMPVFFQSFSEIIPLTHWLVVIRSIVLKGVGFEAFWLPLLKLLGLGALIWALALRSLRTANG